MAEIMFVAPDENLLYVAKQVSASMRIKDIKFFLGALDQGVTVLKDENLEDVKAIISRGGTAYLIREAFPQKAVIDIRTSPFDLVKVLCKCDYIEEPIAIVGYHNIDIFTFDVVKVLNKIFDYNITTVRISPRERAGDKLEEAKKCGIKTIAAGRGLIKQAEQIGLKGILLEAGTQAVIDAFHEAKRIIETVKSNKARINQLNTIINSIAEGILAIDKSGNITIINRVAEKLFDLKAEECIGKKLTDIWPEHELVKCVQEGVALWGCLQKYNDINLAAHMLPILTENEIVGGVTTFQEVEKLHTIESNIRKNLAERGYRAKHTFEKIICNSEEMKRTINKARQIALSESTVLISGETGSGKEVLAQSIHNYSSRKDGPFVAINCAGLPASLLESELFGYAEGAFTGAKKGGKAGLFEQATGGTIFLDEISEMPLELQSHLLRVTQEKEVMRIGDNKIISIDVRIIAATNQDLAEMVKNSRFREDLYYRINVLRLNVPSLRERKEDIEPLLSYFLFKLTGVNWAVSSEAGKLLKQFQWKGNVRQLENFAERLSLLCKKPQVEVNDVIMANEEESSDLRYLHKINSSYLKTLELTEIKRILEEVGGNKKEASRRLGISQTTLWRRLKEIDMK